MDPNSLSLVTFQSVLHKPGRLFSEFWNLYKLRRADLISGGNQFCRMSELFRPPFCISILLDPNSSSFIRFQCIFYDSGLLLSGFSNFYKLKRGGFNFWEGEPIFQNFWIIWCPLLYLNLKSRMDPNSSSFIWFQSILHESRRLFSESWNFYKLRRRDLISGGNQFCRMSELFVPPFCVSILKIF